LSGSLELSSRTFFLSSFTFEEILDQR